jgi:hypothetical protein
MARALRWRLGQGIGTSPGPVESHFCRKTAANGPSQPSPFGLRTEGHRFESRQARLRKAPAAERRPAQPESAASISAIWASIPAEIPSQIWCTPGSAIR